jgi:hypothetical protein
LLLERAATQQTEGSASRQCSERGRAGALSAHGLNPPASQHRECGEGGGAATRRSEAALGPTAMHGTPPRPDGGRRVSTTTVTTARATTTIVDVGSATTVMMTATAAGRQTKGVHGLLVRAYTTRSSLRASVLRPTYQGTMGTLTLACGSRITSSLATPGGDRRPFRHQELAALPRGLRVDMARALATGQDQRLDRPTSGLCR